MESALGVKYVLILALRSQIFEYLRETSCRRALGYLEPARSETKKVKIIFFILRKRLAIVDRIEGLWSVGTRLLFVASPSPRS